MEDVGFLVSFKGSRGKALHTAAIMFDLPIAEDTFRPLKHFGIDWETQLRYALGDESLPSIPSVYVRSSPQFIYGIGYEGGGSYSHFAII